jgi:hypothetical protein
MNSGKQELNVPFDKEDLAVNRTVQFALGLGILICSMWAALMIVAGAYSLFLRFLWIGPDVLWDELPPNPKQLKEWLSLGIGGFIGVVMTLSGFWCAFLRFRSARSYSRRIKELEEHTSTSDT